MNITETTGFDICAAANIQAISGGEWEKITPWGQFQNPKGLQRVTKAEGKEMVQAFNSLAETSGSAFRGIPIYRGHPDVDPEHYPDDRRLGKLLGLAVREDGFYCKPAWNSLGEENKKEGFWLYPSAVWKFNRLPGGVIAPFELVSIGMTNTPNIPGVTPWAENTASGDPVNERAICDDVAARTGRRADYVFSYIQTTRCAVETFAEAAERAANDLAMKKPNPAAAKARAVMLRKNAPLLNELAEAKKREAGFAGATQIAAHAKKLMEEGHTEHVAMLLARARFPGASHDHQATIDGLADAAKKKAASDAQKAFAAKVHALMASEKISYRAAWLRLKPELPAS
jgi:hypothetical protein